MSAYLEHANLTVPDIDEAIRFLGAVEPQFYVRWDAIAAADGGGVRRWVHFGNERVYIALQEVGPDDSPKTRRRSYVNYGINHLGWVVDDFDAVVGRLDRGGYQQSLLVKSETFRRRAYYHDAAGFEWEIIQYLSEDDAQRNAYESA